MQMIWQRIEQNGVSLRTLHKVLIASALVVSATLLIATYHSSDEFVQLAGSADEYIKMRKSATALMEGSDYLTEMVQRFTLAGDKEYLDAYFEEAQVAQRREKAIETMATDSREQSALKELQEAMGESLKLMNREYYAMRLVIEASGEESYPEALQKVELNTKDKALSANGKMERAREIVLGKKYYEQKELIRINLKESLAELEKVTHDTQNKTMEDLGISMTIARGVIIFQTMLIVVMIWLTSRLGIHPVLTAVEHINQDDPIPEVGANEFRYLARTYNKMYEVYKRSLDRLNFKASHDELTQVYNRTGYDLILSAVDISTTCMLLIDLDDFKAVNDTFGHETGDRVLKKVACVVSNIFRSDDYVCRIGGDEFVVFMVHSNLSQRELIESKVKHINAQLANTEDGLPNMSVSVGVAHGVLVNDALELFRAADAALYETKRLGKHGVTFYEEPQQM